MALTIASRMLLEKLEHAHHVKFCLAILLRASKTGITNWRIDISLDPSI